MFDESSAKEEEECVICMDRKASVILPCAHAYCEQCIDAWLVPACHHSVSPAFKFYSYNKRLDRNCY